MHISVDASPWGIGGILYDSLWKPVAYFYDAITMVDCQTLSIVVGSPDYMTIVEALALLVAVRLWANESVGMTLAIRTDNAGCAAVISKLRSSNPSLNRIATELALDMIEQDFMPMVIDHIAGVTNIEPDALSRIFQPGKNYQVPASLMNLIRTDTACRDRSFWRSLEQITV
jgi:hypothetical protein